MKKEEYITTFVVGSRCIPVGLDDAGQTYFFEYVDEVGNLVEECCGSYNTDYQSCIEYRFGDPEKDCPYYESMFFKNDTECCPNNTKYGYCDKCLYQDRKWSNFQDLVKWGIIDRRGNISEKYQKYLLKNEAQDEQ